MQTVRRGSIHFASARLYRLRYVSNFLASVQFGDQLASLWWHAGPQFTFWIAILAAYPRPTFKSLPYRHPATSHAIRRILSIAFRLALIPSQ